MMASRNATIETAMNTEAMICHGEDCGTGVTGDMDGSDGEPG